MSYIPLRSPAEATLSPPGDRSDDASEPDRPWGFAHVPALDGLRGAAVAAVLLFHAGYLTGGYLGVDLFFVLSGYLITSLLLAERGATDRIDLRAFWGRRVRRLLPALLVLMFGIAVYATVIARPVDRGTIRGDGLATLFYVANWHTILRGGTYWDLALAPSPLQHAWSLAIEEQFYVLWPLVVVWLVRRRADAPRAVLRVAGWGAAASASLFVGLHALGASDTRVYEGTDTRAAALLLGAALAAWRLVPGRGDRPPVVAARTVGPVDRSLAAGWTTADWQVEGLGLAAAAALGGLWLFLPGQSAWLYRGGLPLASVLGAAVVLAASRPGSPLLGWGLSVRPLRALGLISYGLYLWHWPIYAALDAENGHLPFLGDRYLHGLAMLAVKLVLSLAAAVLSYRFIESPVRQAVIRRPYGTLTAAAGVVLAAMAIVVSTGGAVAVARPSSIDGQATVHVPGGPEVVFAGDSVAVSLETRVAADPPRYGVNPVNRAQIGCSVAYAGLAHRDANGKAGQTPESCAPAALRDLQDIAPEVVFFMAGARPNDFVQLDGRYVRPCDAAFDRRHRQDLTQLVERLHASGATVVLGTVLHSSENAFGYEGSEERIECTNRVVRDVAAAVPGTGVVDLNELLCPSGQPCIEVLDGEPVRSEGLHFDAGPGGDAVADWTVAQILQAAGVPPAPGTAVRPH